MKSDPRGGTSTVAIAAFLCLPALASAQLQKPADELHTAPWFEDARPQGPNSYTGGGFVAQAKGNAAGWETVTYSVTCGNRTLTEESPPDPQTGQVAALVDCENIDDMIPVDLGIHNVEDGG